MKSVAGKNNLILILSLTPFIVGLVFSLYKSSDTEYLSIAINIAGSQRMRTILLSDCAQKWEDAFLENDLEKMEKTSDLLKNELETYRVYYKGLSDGDSSLGMKENPFPDIRDELGDMSDEMEAYSQSVEKLLVDPENDSALNYIRNSSIDIKDQFDAITNHYQEENDRIIKLNRAINLLMLIFATSITVVGLFLSTVIKKREYQAQFDQLTGTKNRHSFNEFIKTKSPKDCTVFFLDLNKFKTINDNFGHDIGDEILIEASRRLEKALDKNALFRYGGDEFIGVLWHEPSHQEPTEDVRKRIENTVEKIKAEFDIPIIDSDKHEHYIRFAMGVISREVGIEKWETLISVSDKLMYLSKQEDSYVTICNTKKDFESVMKTFEARSINLKK